MISIRRKIANLNVTIEGQESRFLSQLEQELDIYPSAQQKADILIRFGFEGDEKVLANNPAIHREYDDGFSANFGQATVRWHWESSPVLVEWSSPPKELCWRQKIRNIQYTHPYEQVGQIFFELVLIPTLQLFYHQHLLILHGSALADHREGTAMIFGGTGGVGKTSLELSLVGDGYDFMADDISVIGEDGILYANFAWPKIYGYNTFNDVKIKERIFHGRDKLDRFFWELRMKRFGGGKVRRRVDPNVFFDGAVRQQAQLKKYYILFRDYSDEISLSPISTKKAVDMSLHILSAEYMILYRHLYWHQINREGLSLLPFVTRDEIFKSWQMLGTRVLANVQTCLVHIPIETTASQLRLHLRHLVRE